MIKQIFSRKRIKTVLLQLTSKTHEHTWEVCSLQMLAAPGASLCLCFYRGLELFLLSWKQFKQEGGREGTFLWGKQKLKCDLLGGVGLSAQQVLTGTRCCGDTEPLPAPARSSTGQKWTFQCPVSSSRVRITAFCHRNQLPKVWTEISHAMVPKQTKFQPWVYILSKYTQTIFLKISVQVCFSREVKSSLTTLLRTQQRFCLPIVLGSSGAWFLPWAIAASLIPAETRSWFKIPFLSREVLSAPPSLVPKTPVTNDGAHFFQQ